MATENKTKPTDITIETFLAGVEPQFRREEACIIDAMLRDISGQAPVMWGASIIGYGTYDYMSDSGRGGAWMRIGFSPRKPQMTLYLIPGFESLAPLLAKLGEHTTAKSCLYIKKLADIDLDVLTQILQTSWDEMAVRYGA
jgi:Domain of unknown function (DU1801)